MTVAMKIAVVTFTPVANDSRVLRTSQMLADQGYDVHLVGFGEAPRSHSARFHSLGAPSTRLQHWMWVLAGYAPALISPRIAHFMRPLRPIHRLCFDIIRTINPNVIHANDWPALSIAVMAKKATGACIVYDSHEFAREEHAERRLWRLLYRPYVVATETEGIGFADAIVTVGPSIARSLEKIYSLGRTPLVVMNVPNYRSVPDHAPGERLELLYHGLMKPGRGIETLILAMSEIKRPVRLVLRGNGSPGYIANLRILAAQSTQAEQIVFEDAVPFDRVIETAARADIGVFVPPLPTPQARFMLPNKLFEYIMAGLMVIMSDADDVAEIVQHHGCGLVLSGATPSGFAAAIDGLERNDVLQYRDRARATARVLNWETEKACLIELYASLTAQPPCSKGRK
jgi:glycosyltransferase involved in cell wall biosynthesis